MELREFAERVLFATTLDEKLRGPAGITDEHPGPALAAPEAPGRPAGLRFKGTGSTGSGFPGTRLEDERDRGRLLHFFANHELLATELMALVLLRFPEAPESFRRGVLQTLKEEQEHTRLYLERMRACGIEFGELPVSGYFWRAVSGMENPMDYVTGLSLTFEQANLDYARDFARRFAQAGDADSARLLERIHRDEIAHVAYGLKWFRRWKNPDESDWAAFCRQLKYPLSPQRAKGSALNIEGRRAAGLDPDFIAELDIYSQSKGRTPGVFVFNPLAEGHIALGRAFSPVEHQARLVRDLANLPQFLCRQDDIVLVPNRPSVGFLADLKQAGFTLPEFVELGDDPGRAIAALAQRRLGRLRPWAWGPDSAELLAPLYSSVTGEKRTAAQRYNERVAELYSKAWSARFLRKILGTAGPAPWLCTEAEIGVEANSLEQSLAAIATIRRRGHHRVVVKQALGLAGRNAIRLWEPALLETQMQWMKGALARGVPLVIEPWLEREIDFSVQLEMGEEGLKLWGFTGLLNDRKGQFLGNVAAPNFRKHIPAQVAALLREPKDVAVRVQRLFEAIIDSLEPELRHADYIGPVGIDAFVYRAADGSCRLKPVVEINPRYTMGRLTVELMGRACPGSHGLLRLMTAKAVRQEGSDDFISYARALREKFPVRLEGEPVRRLRGGAVCLNDPAEARACLAVFQVS